MNEVQYGCLTMVENLTSILQRDPCLRMSQQWIMMMSHMHRSSPTHTNGSLGIGLVCKASECRLKFHYQAKCSPDARMYYVVNVHCMTIHHSNPDRQVLLILSNEGTFRNVFHINWLWLAIYNAKRDDGSPGIDRTEGLLGQSSKRSL